VGFPKKKRTGVGIRNRQGLLTSILGVKTMLLLKVVADERHLNLNVTKRAREVLPQLSSIF
jgi:hypothetical protein